MAIFSANTLNMEILGTVIVGIMTQLKMLPNLTLDFH